jgi:hypothetical protein
LPEWALRWAEKALIEKWTFRTTGSPFCLHKNQNGSLLVNSLVNSSSSSSTLKMSQLRAYACSDVPSIDPSFYSIDCVRPFQNINGPPFPADTKGCD